MKVFPDISISQCPARKTETTIPNRRNLIQGIVYTGDGTIEEPNKGEHRQLRYQSQQELPSPLGLSTAGSKWCYQSSKARVNQWDLKPQQQTLSRNWDQGGKSRLIGMEIESWKKCQRSRPKLERGADKYPNLPSSPPVSSIN